jgi:hypothetical protein
MLRQLSLTADALYQRRVERLALQVVAERAALERASRCGTAADLDGFEPVLETRLEAIR